MVVSSSMEDTGDKGSSNNNNNKHRSVRTYVIVTSSLYPIFSASPPRTQMLCPTPRNCISFFFFCFFLHLCQPPAPCLGAESTKQTEWQASPLSRPRHNQRLGHKIDSVTGPVIGEVLDRVAQGTRRVRRELHFCPAVPASGC